MTLRTRIAATASASVALAILTAAIGLYVAVRSDLRGEVDSALRARAHDLTGQAGSAPRPDAGALGAGASTAGGAGPPRPADGPSPGGFGAPGGGPDGLPGSIQPAPFGAASGYVEFVSADGAVFVPSGQGTESTRIPLTARDRAIAAAGSASSLTDRQIGGTHLRVLSVGVAGGGAVIVARSLTEVGNELSRLLLLLVLIGGAGILLAALLGALVARTALAPISRFTRRTESLTGSVDLSQRLEVRGRDELARLAESFNAALDALERSVAAQRHLIADAGHELRTPISSLRANIQTLGEASRLSAEDQASLRADVLAELDELTALVGDVVELARGASPSGESEDVRLDALVRAAAESARRRGDVRFELELAPTIVHGAADRVARAVSNLIDNARRWSPPEGVVEVGLREGVLSVRDHGPGFNQADIPFVFDRFYRAREARGLPGSGLGLAIVRQAAEACGGFAEAANAPGGGALLRVGFGPAEPVPEELANTGDPSEQRANI